MIKVPMSLCFAKIESPLFPLPRLPLALFLSPVVFFFFTHAIFSPFPPNGKPGSRLVRTLTYHLLQHSMSIITSFLYFILYSNARRQARTTSYKKVRFTVMFIHCHRTKILAQILPSIKREKNTEVKREKTKLKSNDMSS